MDPWDRRESETRRAYAAFLAFRNLGPLRTVPEAVEKFYGNFTVSRKRNWYRWSGANDWHDRASAWDRYMYDRRAMEREESRKEMEDRHAINAKRVGKVAELYTEWLLEDPERIYEMSPRDALAYFEIHAKVERLAMGETTENFQLTNKAESVLDQMRRNPEAQAVHSELVSILSGAENHQRSINGRKSPGHIPSLTPHGSEAEKKKKAEKAKKKEEGHG